MRELVFFALGLDFYPTVVNTESSFEPHLMDSCARAFVELWDAEFEPPRRAYASRRHMDATDY